LGTEDNAIGTSVTHLPLSPAYSFLTLIGIAVAAAVWRRLPNPHPAPPVAFLLGLAGAILGAKLGYILAEGVFELGQPNAWQRWLVGKTVLGALLGGYAGVEVGKRMMGFRHATGDAFAVVAPLGLAIGRIGCLLHGCCFGRPCGPAWYAWRDAAGLERFPTQIADGLFQLAFAIVAYLVVRRAAGGGQMFHVYLIAYGVFRMVQEPFRDSHAVAGVQTYQVLAGVVALVGVWRYLARRACSA
jgi:phosphatidylglycerol:prolipoprotein diacylglycerol transferase